MAAVDRRDFFLNNIIPLCIFLLIIMMSASSSKAITNVLTSGQSSFDKLGYPNSKVSLSWSFCNLVLTDDKGVARWKSRTGGLFNYFGCALSLNNNGQLVLTGYFRQVWIYFRHQVWISDSANSVAGTYVAVLLPEAKLTIYAPPIWGVGEPTVKESSIGISSNSDINNNEMVSSMTNLKKIPAINNVLISGDRLYNGSSISENGYIFILVDCELILKNSSGKITWQTFTHDYGINCFARLNYRGVLTIFDKYHAVVWTNEEQLALPQPFGEYALIMQSNGVAAIYGPAIWSRPKPYRIVIPRDDLIEMPTVMM